MSIIKQDYGSLGNDVQTQMLIAPVLAEMKADRAFSIGEQFIVDSVLYKATSAIASGADLVVGTNCEVSDSITQQMDDAIKTVGYNLPGASISAGGTPGTYVDQKSVNVALTGYTPIGVSLLAFAHPTQYNASVFLRNNTVYIYYFKTNTVAYTIPDGDVQVTVIYKKNR